MGAAVKKEKRAGLTAFQLKALAIASMAADHIGAVLYTDEVWLRYAGRLAFPIFCFLLVEGYCHTRDVRKYMGRLGLFALISEYPFDLAFHHRLWTLEKQNVFFTLFIGLGMLWLLDKEKDIVIRIGIVLLAMWAAEFLHTDYGFRGILLIAVFQMAGERKTVQYMGGAAWNFLWESRIQNAGALAVIPIALYNGKKGRSMKYFFYLFYPVHLMILYLLAYKCS